MNQIPSIKQFWEMEARLKELADALKKIQELALRIEEDDPQSDLSIQIWEEADAALRGDNYQ